MKDITTVCRDSPTQCDKAADVLTQLMQTEDPTELSLINMSLVSILKANPKGSLYCLSHSRINDPKFQTAIFALFFLRVPVHSMHGRLDMVSLTCVQLIVCLVDCRPS